jgi:hypothetical protein
MSSVLSQDAFNKFLTDSLNADSSAAGEGQSRQEFIDQTNAMYDETVEQAKSAAMEAGANLVGIGGIEAIRAVKGLYTAGQGLYTRIQQVKDTAVKLKAQYDAKAAKIEQLKEQKFNEAQARNAEIDPLTGEAKGAVLDKEAFMADADAAISKASRSSAIASFKGAVAERLQPVIDRVSASAEGVISNVADRVNTAQDFLKNGFAQYTDTANQLKATYLDRYAKARNLTDEQLSTRVAKGQDTLNNFIADSKAKGIEGLDEHTGAIKDLLDQGTRQSVAQAGTLYDNLKGTMKAVVPYQKLKKAQSDITDLKASAEQQKADVMSGLEETRADITSKINASQTRLEVAKSLPENHPSFRSAGASKDEVVSSIQRDIDNQNLDLEGRAGQARSALGDIEASTSAKLGELNADIATHTSTLSSMSDAIAGGSEGLLSRMSEGVSSAVSSVGEGITAVRSALAPVTEAVGTLLAPVAVWQGSLSAENIVEGKDSGNMSQLATDAINVRFGVGAARQIGQKAQSFLSGDAGDAAKAAAEKSVEDIGTKEATQLAAQGGKSAGTMAGEDIAAAGGEALGEAGGGELGEAAAGVAIADVIPVVGEIADVAMVGFGLYEGIKDLFDPDKPPPPPPPPPAITQSIAFTGQAGVY